MKVQLKKLTKRLTIKNMMIRCEDLNKININRFKILKKTKKLKFKRKDPKYFKTLTNLKLIKIK